MKNIIALVSVIVLAFYVVFILSLMQKRKLSDLNTQLINEKNWHEIACEDALTGLKNRTAYIERINDLERAAPKNSIIHAVMIDIDNFKHINDSLGHHFGDITLQKTAEFINNYFSEDNYEAFRIGGDEFALVAVDVKSGDLEQKINRLLEVDFQKIGCSLSVGYSLAKLEQNRAIEKAFDLADQRMYEMKIKKKR